MQGGPSVFILLRPEMSPTNLTKPGNHHTELTKLAISLMIIFRHDFWYCSICHVASGVTCKMKASALVLVLHQQQIVHCTRTCVGFSRHWPKRSCHFTLMNKEVEHVDIYEERGMVHRSSIFCITRKQIQVVLFTEHLQDSQCARAHCK